MMFLEAEIPILKQYLGALLAAFLFWLLVTFIAKKKGFFQLEKATFPPTSFSTLVGGIFTYVFGSLLIVPAIIITFLYIVQGKVDYKQLSDKIWWTTASLGLLFVCLFLYGLLIKSTTLKLFGASPSFNPKKMIKDLGWGALAWCVSYPSVILMGIIGTLLSQILFGKSGVNQTAIQYLLNTTAYPILFAITVLFLITIVPLMEEFLFRGLLQTWLKKYCGRVGSIVITAIIFAFAHFAPSQGTGNLELILSLFVLALFLGFIYERQQSLWAPIGLHMTFNAFNIFLLLVTDVR